MQPHLKPMILLFFLCVVLWFAWGVYRFFGYRYHGFAGRVVLVTGACSEVGRRLCVQLHAEGASVIAWDYSKVKLDELQRDILSLQLHSNGSSRSSSTTPVPTSPAGGSSSPSPPASAGAQGKRTPLPGTGGSTFFEVAMVDLSSRLQVQRAVKELLASLPVLCASHRQQVRIGGGVDMVFNAAHANVGKPLLERGEDTIEKAVATNTMAPLLLAKLLCPLMLERKEGGHFVTLTAALGASLIDAASPDYAASEWGAVGAHYSVRAWLQQLQRDDKLPGEVRTTLISLDAVQLGLLPYGGPAATSVTAASSALNRTSATSAATGLLRGNRDSSSEPNGETDSSGKLDAINGANATGFTPVNPAQAASLALDRVVQRALRAVGRGEESYCPSYRAALSPLAFVLPVPWMSAVLKVFTWEGFSRKRGVGPAKLE